MKFINMTSSRKVFDWLAFVIAFCMIVSLDSSSAEILTITCDATYNDTKPTGVATFAVQCPADCTLATGSVFGSTIYSGTSPICRAAIHHSNRYLTDAGGIVTVEAQSLPLSFSGAISNGITSQPLAANPGDTAFTLRMDVDECVELSDNCDDNATCTNTAGSFTCACNSGYTGNGVTCADANECIDSTHNCNQTQSCVNNVGSFTCVCKEGYTGDPDSCTDINECLFTTSPCSSSATCTNNEGSYICTCNVGYIGDGITCLYSSATKPNNFFFVFTLMTMCTSFFNLYF